MDKWQWFLMAGWTVIVAGLAYWLGRARGERVASASEWEDAYRDGRADALAEVHERHSLRAQRAARTRKARATSPPTSDTPSENTAHVTMLGRPLPPLAEEP